MIWLIYILLDALVNWWLIEREKTKPFYLILFIVRGWAAILYGVFVLDVQGDWHSTYTWFLRVTLPFPFVFNTTLNLLRGEAFIYYGADSGWIDSFVVKHEMQYHYFCITLILFILSFFTGGLL